MQDFLYPFGRHTILAVGKHFTHRWGHASAALTTRSGLSDDPAEIP